MYSALRDKYYSSEVLMLAAVRHCNDARKTTVKLQPHEQQTVEHLQVHMMRSIILLRRIQDNLKERKK